MTTWTQNKLPTNGEEREALRLEAAEHV